MMNGNDQQQKDPNRAQDRRERKQREIRENGSTKTSKEAAGNS
jgi:hypothetical protein